MRKDSSDYERMQNFLTKFNIPYDITIEDDGTATITVEKNREFHYFYFTEYGLSHGIGWDYQYSLE